MQHYEYKTISRLKQTVRYNPSPPMQPAHPIVLYRSRNSLPQHPLLRGGVELYFRAAQSLGAAHWLAQWARWKTA